MNKLQKTGIALFAIAVILLLGFGHNDAGNREVIVSQSGEMSVRFKPGIYWAGIGSDVTTWPNNITISFSKEEASDEISGDNVMEMGKDSITFGSDGSVAYVKAIAQFNLPDDEASMINIQVTHKSPEGLCARRLAPYTKACLQSSGQLMSAEQHYSGGKGLMISEYKDQLMYGMFILTPRDSSILDTIDNTIQKTTEFRKTHDRNGKILRDKSDIAEYNISLGGAVITDVRYSPIVTKRLERKQLAATEASIAKQERLTAEQQALTEKAKGERQLTITEYQQKKAQVEQLVKAQTQVELAKQDLIKQEIAEKAAMKEAGKIKVLADARAYEKKRIMEADGGLELKANTWLEAQKSWAEAFGAYGGNLVPNYYVAGRDGTGGAMNGGLQFMEIMAAKAAEDLKFNAKATK